MPYEHDELNKRAAQREAYARKRKAMQRRRKIRSIVTLVAILAVCGLIVGVLLLRQENNPTDPTLQTTLPPVTTAPAETLPQEPQTVINLTFGGDVNITDASVAAGQKDGAYNYAEVFKDVTPALAASDLTILNFEGNFYGAPYGTSTSSAPIAMAQALKAAGVDMLQIANSYTIANGIIGMKQTLDAVRSAGLTPLGAYGSNEEFRNSGGYTMVGIRGVRVAIVAFTKGMGSLGLPAGSENCVNVLYEDYASSYKKVNTEGITAILNAANEEAPDVTIALVHWGSEYNDYPSDSQAKIVQLMQSLGVDAIVGTHPHYVQQVVFDQDAGTVVAYSLGDFYGSGEKNGTYYSVLLNLQVTKDNLTGETRITQCTHTPIYLLTPERDGEPLRLMRMEAAIESYEGNHVDKITQIAYENMCYALKRANSRVEIGK
jgi:poly-gamma-glutamate synthesis protein (capsule biosynthesis protein)